MSGPKVSVYTLTAMEMAAIAEEIRRREEMARRRAQLLQKGRECEAALKERSQQLKNMEQSVRETQGWVSNDEFKSRLQSVSQLVSDAKHILAGLPNLLSNDEIESRLSDVSTAMGEIHQQLGIADSQEAQLKDRLERALDHEIFGLFDDKAGAAQGQAQADKSSSSEQEASPFTAKCIEELLVLKDNPYLPMTYRKKVDRALARMREANAAHQLKAFCEVELPEVLKKCQSFLSLWDRIGQEYQQLMSQYEALCDMNGTTERTALVFDKEALTKLKAMIVIEEQKTREQAQKAYIQQALSEVMEDMGYSVLGHRDVTKRTGKHFQNELYRYGYDTAINVTYDDSGQIALELGKMDHDDRLPSSDECNYLENQMMAFCDHFKEVEARLAGKGVIVGNRIALAPPSADYAQIINVNDYEMAEQDQTKQQSEGKRKATHPKASALS